MHPFPECFVKGVVSQVLPDVAETMEDVVLAAFVDDVSVDDFFVLQRSVVVVVVLEHEVCWGCGGGGELPLNCGDAVDEAP